MELYQKIRVFEDISNLASFFIAFFVIIRSKDAPRYMRTFLWYPFIGLIFTLLHILTAYLNSFPWNVFHIVNNLSILFHFCFLASYIILFTENHIDKNRSKAFFWPLLAAIVSCLIIKEMDRSNPLAFGIANFGLALLCVSYYNSIFRSRHLIPLLEQPSFWIINSVFFGMLINVPAHIARTSFKQIGVYELETTLFALCSLAYIIMHILTIKAYLCIVRPNKIF